MQPYHKFDLYLFESMTTLPLITYPVMETSQMKDKLTIDGLNDLSFDCFLASDDTYDFDADSGIFDMGFADLSANAEKLMDTSMSAYLKPDHAFAINLFSIYTSDNTSSDLDSLSGYQALEINIEQAPETCQLSSVGLALDTFHQSPLISHPLAAATCPSLEYHLQHSECSSIGTDLSYASSRLIVGSEDVSGSNEASHADIVKPRKKRGRKRANISDEERRSRKLNRGRVAANKCRQKKRATEHELASQALLLLDEHEKMLEIDHDLRDEIMSLQCQILKHVDGKCGGIPNAEQITSSVNIPHARLEEVERRDELKSLLGNKTYRSDSIAIDTNLPIKIGSSSV